MNKIQETRGKFRLRIGEIIEAAIGSPKLREFFEAAEKGGIDERFKIAVAEMSGNAPSGMLALQMGLVDKETKEALLTAQAAERTWQSLEQLEKFYDQQLPELQQTIEQMQATHQAHWLYDSKAEIVNTYYDAHVGAANIKDPSFKFIGSEGDPETLVCAQAVYQLMTQYEHNEKSGHKEQVAAVFMRVPDFEPFGTQYMDAFKKAIANSYRDAASILVEKGYVELAKEMTEVHSAISFDASNAQEYTIAHFADRMVTSQHSLTNQINAVLDPWCVRDTPYCSVSDQWEKTIVNRSQQALRCA